MPIDLLLDEAHNLADPLFQETVSVACQGCIASFWAPECSTLSRAREKAIPGHPNAPQPLRSVDELRGRMSLSDRDRHKVEVANAFVDFTFREAQRSVDEQRGIAMENPLRSWLWSFPQLESLRKDADWVRVEYDMTLAYIREHAAKPRPQKAI